MSSNITVHYIEYDPFPKDVQKFSVAVSCRKPHTMRVTCNNQVVKTATVCDGKSEEVVSFDVPVSQTHNKCVFEFLYNNKTVITRTVRYKGGVSLYDQSVNERPTSVIANTVIIPGDYSISTVKSENMVENIIVSVLVMSARVFLTLKSNDYKPATGSFCVSGRCVGLFTAPGGTSKLTFGINIDEEVGLCDVFTTPDLDAANHIVYMINRTNSNVVKSLPYLPLMQLGNCKVERYYMGWGKSISVSRISGSIITTSSENVITISGTGMVKMRLGMPLTHEINMFLFEQSVSISAEYDLYTNVITCSQN